MHFDDVIGATMHLCARNALTMTLAMIDLDRFKDINDAYGHPFGDACLRHVATLLRTTFRRDTDTAIRYGGEELAVVNAGTPSAEMLERLETFRQHVDQSVVALDGVQSRLTLSIGVWSGVPGPTDDPQRILERADTALYQAKRSGRNRIVVAE
jgi:polar amino acid transport system substrate-binding protein